jgi:hypothetical protein
VKQNTQILASLAKKSISINDVISQMLWEMRKLSPVSHLDADVQPLLEDMQSFLYLLSSSDFSIGCRVRQNEDALRAI